MTRASCCTDRRNGHADGPVLCWTSVAGSCPRVAAAIISVTIQSTVWAGSLRTGQKRVSVTGVLSPTTSVDGFRALSVTLSELRKTAPADSSARTFVVVRSTDGWQRTNSSLPLDVGGFHWTH